MKIVETIWHNQDEFERFLVTEYFRHGSINKVYSSHHYNLPISFAGYHRILTRFGVIKSAGPNSRLSESLHLLSKLATYKIPLEKLYHHHAPQTIQISTNTLHRILHYTRLGLTRRQGTALLITPVGQPDSFLTGLEKDTPNSSTGKRGDLALPMGHSKTGEDPKDAIARVLQQEVFTDLVVNSMFPWELIPPHPKPIMYINIADIKVAVYHLEFPNIFSYSSFKLSHLRYRNLVQMSQHNLRPGVLDICQTYLKSERDFEIITVPVYDSRLNLALAKAENP